MSLKKSVVTWTVIASLAPLLAGCFGAAVVGMGAGALMATDRRPSETYLADEAIELRAGNRIGEQFGSRVHVNVTSYNLTVLLTGEVPDAATAAEVEKIVGNVPNVKAVANELVIAGASSLGGRGNDSYLTAKVKGRFVDIGKFSPTHVKVTSESGTVFLMGMVTQAEADAAVDIARTTSGVQKVVRMFEVISPEEARRRDNLPPASSGQKPAQKSGN